MVSMRSNNKNLEQYPKASGRFMMDQAMGFQGFNMFASAINMGLNHLAQLRHTGGQPSPILAPLGHRPQLALPAPSTAPALPLPAPEQAVVPANAQVPAAETALVVSPATAAPMEVCAPTVANPKLPPPAAPVPMEVCAPAPAKVQTANDLLDVVAPQAKAKIAVH
ncbi:unnamed protein product [Durusdinium trenchii]|uniref:Uncharacterized protein n=2 Tax=Durusdinium trenchii TaxID=1381693 RepID=A0ABP0JDW0_9DINO